MEQKSNNPMLEWAEREIALACESEKEAVSAESGDDAEYGIECYKSALRAYKSLLSDSHSGFSIQIAKSILNRLVDGKCLTPIEDTSDIWSKISEGNYQCKRMSSLFKKVSADGTVVYTDVDRAQIIDINHPDLAYYDGLASRLVDKIFPITMPYLPSTKKFRVYTEAFSYGPRAGDYDTRACLYILTPGGLKVELNRYFKEGSDGKMIPIEKTEYEARKAKKVK